MKVLTLLFCIFLTACGGGSYEPEPVLQASSTSFPCKVVRPAPVNQWQADLATWFDTTEVGKAQFFAGGTLVLNPNCTATFTDVNGAVQILTALSVLPSVARSNPALYAEWSKQYGLTFLWEYYYRSSGAGLTLSQLTEANDPAIVPDQMFNDMENFFTSPYIINNRAYAWAGGTIIRDSSTRAQFSNGVSTVIITRGASMTALAANNPLIAALWKADYGFLVYQ